MNNSPLSRLAARILGLALAATAAGCVDQAKEVALYRKQLDAMPGVATTPVPTEEAPLTLQAALQLAEKNDESLGLSGETYVQALIAKDREFATLLPQINLGPTLSESQPARGAPGPIHNFTIPLNASLNAFNLQDYAAIDEDSATAEQNRQLLLNEQQTILFDVVQDYYAVLQNERSVEVYQSSLAEQEELVRQAKAKYNLGNGTPLAIAQSQSQASSTRVQLIQAEASVVTARAMLAFLVGSPVTTRPLVDGFVTPADELQPVEGWIAEADIHRQDLAAADAGVLAARQGVRAAMSEYMPSVTVNLQYLIYKETQPLNNKLSGGISANIPIFTGGQIEADVRSAFSVLRSALLTQSQTRKQVEDDIRTAYANLQSSRDQIRELRVELSANRDALVLAQREEPLGLAITLDVLTAQAALLSTQLSLATQEYQEKINYLDLLRVSGRLTLADATPTTHPSTEPADLIEITTPNEISTPTTAPAQ
ncbi:MAG: TolC family protein [Tepidisphaeraceae bacterium]|jgi:protease secretion system outer membrane protein